METRSSKSQALGLSGLSNVGNTCYLNSFAQVLSHTYEFNEFLDQKTYEMRLNRRPESLLLIEWDKLRQLMWSQDCTIAPWGFVKSVQRVSKLKGIDLFSGFAQNDIQEFLMFMMDGFHMSIARAVDMTISGTAKNDKDMMAKECYKMMSQMYENDYSEIVRIFCGIHVSRIQSINTGESLSVRPEPFFLLSLPIPPGPNTMSIEACMDEYTKQERLEGENAWFNEKTNQKEDVDKEDNDDNHEDHVNNNGDPVNYPSLQQTSNPTYISVNSNIASDPTITMASPIINSTFMNDDGSTSFISTNPLGDLMNIINNETQTPNNTSLTYTIDFTPYFNDMSGNIN